MTPNYRLPGERFAAYKLRCARLSFLQRPSQWRYRLLWNSGKRGTYVRAKHGALGRGAK